MLHLDGRPVLRRLEKQFSKRRPAHPALPGAVAPASATPAPPANAGMPASAAPAPQPKAVKGPPLPPGAGAKPAVPAPAARNEADAAKIGAPKEMPLAAEKRQQPPVPGPEGPAPAPEKRADAPRPQEAADITATLTDRTPEERRAAKPRRSRKGAIMTWALLLAVFGVMGLGVRHAIQHPVAVWATVDSLPEPAPRVVRSVWELVRPPVDAPQSAPAADPQSQKADRLPDAEAPQGN